MWDWGRFANEEDDGDVRNSKRVKARSKKANWFERLTVDQNKQLCRAAKLRCGGNKKELIDRLLGEEQTSKFAPENNFVALNVERIKGMCRARNLQVSGNKFDLVLRILHSDNGTTPEGQKLKRSATDVVSSVDATTGKVVEKHVPKKRKKASPTASEVYTKVQKKIESVKQKKYQSHWGSKTHASDVYGLAAKSISGVLESKEDYLTNDPCYVLSIAKAAITSITDNWRTIRRPGYDDLGGWWTIDSSLQKIAVAAKPVLSPEERGHAADWIEKLYMVGKEYGLTLHTDIMKTVEFLRGDDACQLKDTEDEDDEKKPAAAVTTVVSRKAGEDSGRNLIKENVVNSTATAHTAQVASPTTERQDNARKMKLHMVVMEHAAQCDGGGCSSNNCTKMRGLLKHPQQCAIKAKGGCNTCKRIWALLQIHARLCKGRILKKEDESLYYDWEREPTYIPCPVPNCAAIRARMKRMQKERNEAVDICKPAAPMGDR